MNLPALLVNFIYNAMAHMQRQDTACTKFRCLLKQAFILLGFERCEQEPDVGFFFLRAHLFDGDGSTGFLFKLADLSDPFAVAAIEQRNTVCYVLPHYLTQIMRLLLIQRNGGIKGQIGIHIKAYMQFFPERLHDYLQSPYARLMRLHQPTGILLLLWPCWWSITLATPPGASPDIFLLVLFGVGAILMRAAGCIVNDWWDRKIDRKVERTKNRPLAAGTVSQKGALTLLFSLLAISLLILLQLNTVTQILGVFSLLPVALYPLMKRWIKWPQAFLGLTFNWGALMGWTAVTGEFNWPMLWLYVAGFSWTMAYDTIYALQDKKDDERLGVKSTAIAFGKDVKLWVSGFFALCVVSLVIAGLLSGVSGLYFAGLAGMSLLFWLQVHTLEPGHPADAMAKFKLNGWAGAVLFAGGILDKWI